MKYGKLLLITALFLTITSPAFARTAWTKTQLTNKVEQASRVYHLTYSQTKWLQKAALDIVFIGAAESHGAYWARNGQHAGMFQFTPSWSQNKYDRTRHRNHKYRVNDWRLCPCCSVLRFVRSYRDGGKSAIERHWKATLYR